MGGGGFLANTNLPKTIPISSNTNPQKTPAKMDNLGSEGSMVKFITSLFNCKELNLISLKF